MLRVLVIKKYLGPRFLVLDEEDMERWMGWLSEGIR
jgi:hypothetical protein